MVFILFFMQVDSQSEKSPSGRQICKIKRASPNSQSDSQPKSHHQRHHHLTEGMITVDHKIHMDLQLYVSVISINIILQYICISNFYKHHCRRSLVICILTRETLLPVGKLCYQKKNRYFMDLQCQRTL